MELTEKQSQIRDRVLSSSGKEIITLRGSAGTGKTITATEIIKDKLNQDKSSFICVIAPTNAALGVLRKKLSHIKTPRLVFKTLSSLMTTPQQYVEFMTFKFNMNDVGMHELSNMLETSFKCTNVYEIIVKEKQVRFDNLTQQYVEDDIYMINKEELYKALSSKIKSLKPDDVKVDVEFIYTEPSAIRDELKRFSIVVIDEMPMVNQDEVDLLQDALNLATNKNVQSRYANKSVEVNTPASLPKYPTYLFAGDRKQLEPVEGVMNKYMLEEAQDDINNIYELTQILRSTDDIAKIGHLINKKVKFKDLQNFYKDNIILFNRNPDKFVEENIDKFAEADIVLTFTNKNVNMLNQRIRDYHGYSNTPGVKENEQIIVTANAYGKDNTIVANGEEYFIKKLYTPEETVAKIKDDDDELFGQFKQSAQNSPQLLDLYEFSEVIAELGEHQLAIISNNQDREMHVWLANDLKYYNKSFSFENAARKLNDMCRLNGDKAPAIQADFGYARTVNKSQGSEWKNVAMLLTSKDLWITKGKTNLPYTAATRAKEKLRIFVEN